MRCYTLLLGLSLLFLFEPSLSANANVRVASMANFQSNKSKKSVEILDSGMLVDDVTGSVPWIAIKEEEERQLCGADGQLYREQGNVLQRCAKDADCLLPATCHSSGFCCILLSTQEPTPVGCSKGMRPLKNAQGDELHCKPNQSHACPRDSTCHKDSYNGLFRCCEKDPSEGCASGTRVLKHANGTSQLCMPGATEHICPGTAICQWSFTTDRYQCCEPENGRSIGHTFVTKEVDSASSQIGSGSNGSGEAVVKCWPNVSHGVCPDGAAYNFNFWSTAYQCCRHFIAEFCSIGDVPYLTAEFFAPFSCHVDDDCPSRYYCHKRTNLCCGSAGKCARSDQHPYRDSSGGLRACSPADLNSCPAGAECAEAVVSTIEKSEHHRQPLHYVTHHYGIGNQAAYVSPRQFLCCTTDANGGEDKEVRENARVDVRQQLVGHEDDSDEDEVVTKYSCQLYGIPFPSAKRPQRCITDDPNSCPVEMLCQASNVPYVNICCAINDLVSSSPTATQKLCPKGWLPHDGINTFCHPTLWGSCPNFSSCILSPLTHQFLCCVPKLPRTRQMSSLTEKKTIIDARDSADNSVRDIALSTDPPFGDPHFTCPNVKEHVELINGRARRCSTRARTPRSRCGVGFTCRRAVRALHSPFTKTNTTRVQRRNVCCGEPQKRMYDANITVWRDEPLFRCPNPGQLPYLVDNSNVYCNIGHNDCPLGTSCQSAINSANMFICCQNADALLGIDMPPQCPGQAVAQSAPLGYVPCDLLRPNQCRVGYICVPAVDDPTMALCCSRTTNYHILCPNQQSLYLEVGKPRYCSLNQQAPCPVGFSCQEAVDQPDVYACCSLPTHTVCPTGYVPSDDYYSGGIINCSPSDMNVCPLDSQCLQAQNRASAYLCCRSTAAPRVCPFDQHALLRANSNQLETCTSPSSSCSSTAFTCQFSSVINAYVCCGRPQPAILCADGQETYAQEADKTFVCNPMAYPRDCPSGFECSHSNVGNVHVCCRQMTMPLVEPQQQPDTFQPQPSLLPSQQTATFRPPVDEITCPIGWSAYEDSRGAHHFCLDALDMSCPQGFSCAQSSIAGIFMCCRLASIIQCPKFYSTLLINNSPRLCSLYDVSEAPPSPSSLWASLPSGQPQLTGNGVCPFGYSCMQSSVPAVYVCCSPTARGDLMCRDGQIPAYLGQFVRSCAVIGSTDGCPPSYLCAPSDRPGLNVCCHSLLRQTVASAAKRILRQQKVTQLAATSVPSNTCDNEAAIPFRNPTDGQPLECKPLVAKCPRGYKCSRIPASNGKQYCCQLARCPSGEHAVSSNGQSPQSCKSDEDCVNMQNDGIVRTCQTAENIKEMKICCNILLPPIFNSQQQIIERIRRTRCLNEADTLIVRGSAYACNADNNAEHSCPLNYHCTRKTTLGEAICCATTSTTPTQTNNNLVPRTPDLRVCPDNREPYREKDNGMLAYCDDNRESCPSGYLCKAGVGVAKRRHICCSPVASCPRGLQPLIDRKNNAVRCSGVRFTDCPAGYLCSESTAPELYVCCLETDHITK